MQSLTRREGIVASCGLSVALLISLTALPIGCTSVPGGTNEPMGSAGSIALPGMGSAGTTNQLNDTFVAKSARFILTSAAGDKLTEQGNLSFQSEAAKNPIIAVRLDQRRQTLKGFGGAFTESMAKVLALLPAAERTKILEAYFSEGGAAYTLARTHIGSSDFSFGKYSYAEAEDATLSNFSLAEDEDDLLPLLKDARSVSGASFSLMASPWTAPPWMKDNGEWFVKPSAENSYKGSGGRLKPEHYKTFALYLSKYIQALEAEGIPVWAITPENEPNGNGGQWESMEFSPAEMRTFLRDNLGPQLAADGLKTEVYIYDQNRADAYNWANTIFADAEAAKYATGTAVHWYDSTINSYTEELDRVHEKFPEKLLINSEATIDALRDQKLEMDPPGDSSTPWGTESGTLHYWKNDAWWWEKNATDWGFYWAEDKSAHPMYSANFRYANDIIQGLNHWLVGWIDWNMVLDHLGGPNHASNWCTAPIMVKTKTAEVYYTPLYYIMSHFSKFLRPGATVVGVEKDPTLSILVTAAQNVSGEVVLVLANDKPNQVNYSISINGKNVDGFAPASSVQTIVLSE